MSLSTDAGQVLDFAGRPVLGVTSEQRISSMYALRNYGAQSIPSATVHMVIEAAGSWNREFDVTFSPIAGDPFSWFLRQKRSEQTIYFREIDGVRKPVGLLISDIFVPFTTE